MPPLPCTTSTDHSLESPLMFLTTKHVTIGEHPQPSRVSNDFTGGCWTQLELCPKRHTFNWWCISGQNGRDLVQEVVRNMTPADPAQ
jgi:hypothetical protein